MDLMNPLGNILRIIVYTIPSLIIIAACFIYLKEGDKLIGLMLLIGSILGLASMLCSSICSSFFIKQIQASDINLSTIYNMTTLVSMMGSFLFAFGFLKLIKSINEHPTLRELDEF